MINWLKTIFKSPKAVVGNVIDSLDLLVPMLAKEIEKAEKLLASMNHMEKAQWVIDKVQSWIKLKFGISEAIQ